MSYGWAVVAAGVLLHLTLGNLYTLGNIAPYYASYVRAHTDPEYRLAQTPWIFAIQLSAQAVTMFFGGRLELLLGPRAVTLLGGTIMSAGVVLTAWAVDVGPLCVLFTYALLPGAGTGLCYSAPLVCAMRWLPDWKGWVSGFIIAGFGFGSFGLNFLQLHLVNPNYACQSMRRTHLE